jgi:hypothetical protein
MEQKSNNGCCKDEVKTFKASPDQTLVKAFSLQAPVLVADVVPSCPFWQHRPSFDGGILPAAPVHGPPLHSDVPLYLQVRCLRI